uniref:F-box associated beta-propeller type 3 domain-containing protein n=1 Tax=Oryza barthii TaxID=65489 RepID=A0A0D3EXK0_9ORYZ
MDTEISGAERPRSDTALHSHPRLSRSGQWARSMRKAAEPTLQSPESTCRIKGNDWILTTKLRVDADVAHHEPHVLSTGVGSTTGLGYDTATGEHKVVRLFKRRDGGEYSCEVYTQGAGGWRRGVGRVPPCAANLLPALPPVFVDGYLYWLLRPDGPGEEPIHRVLSFSMGAEQFGWVYVPPRLSSRICHLADLDGSLCAVYDNRLFGRVVVHARHGPRCRSSSRSRRRYLAGATFAPGQCGHRVIEIDSSTPSRRSAKPSDVATPLGSAARAMLAHEQMPIAHSVPTVQGSRAQEQPVQRIDRRFEGVSFPLRSMLCLEINFQLYSEV